MLHTEPGVYYAIYLILLTILGSMYYYYIHLADEKTETEIFPGSYIYQATEPELELKKW